MNPVVTPVVTSARAPRATIAPVAEPEVSFVLVAYGTGSILVDTIASIEATMAGQAIEVIVIDNPHPSAIDRAYTELLLGTRGVRVARPSANLGFGGGCNAGVELAGGRHLVLLNPDVTLLDGWFDPLATALDEPTVMIAAPVLVNDDGSVQECGQRLFSDGTTFPELRRPSGAEPFDADYASAACWVMRTDDFRSLGGFDLGYHPAYFEDVDLVLRARREGGRCVVHPRSTVIHHQGNGTPDLPAPAHAQRELLLDTWTDTLQSYPAPTAG